MTDITKRFTIQQSKQVPISFWYHFSAVSGVDLDGIKQPEIIDNNVLGTKKLVEVLSPDFVKLMSDGLFNYDFNHTSSDKKETIYEDIIPIDENHPWLTKTFELVTRQKQVIGDRLSFYNIFSPTTLLKWALVKNEDGSHNKADADQAMAEAILYDPDGVESALQVIAQDVAKQVEVAIRAGADGIYYSTQVIQDDRLSQVDFKKFVARTDREVLKAADQIKAINILHICGNGEARNSLEWFKDYEVDVVNWSTNIEHVSLKKGKEIFLNQVVLGGFGNTKDDVLYNGTKLEIEEYTAQLLSDSGEENIILGANCTVPRDIETEQLQWAIATVKNQTGVSSL
ncbi:uroporphyrinogen III decarboxylase [Leuconostoc carnosum]|uniref:uroporphyrinogen decarboxylase family protein n=1 Tax=Leuconostoc carnosum TaxID=1252 RepID=UPI00123BCFBB|nr:uroporphyrinogen decarboxylase family protein [Leuconostoc carnosum]KAA8371441.1 uroporphyrinogen III decarboxylase [Leuconostoc carnosum]KAA8383162.1 uroporphyrinogen III decarboxylase [Leuconostoc carnosum]